jgi:hypothetical protein
VTMVLTIAEYIRYNFSRIFGFNTI